MNRDRVEQSSTGPGDEQLPQLLDGPTLARLLGTTERHVRRLVAERRIPFVRVGRFIRFEPNAIARWLEDRVTAIGDFAP
jgi:excisionase family DNA binding protein